MHFFNFAFLHLLSLIKNWCERRKPILVDLTVLSLFLWLTSKYLFRVHSNKQYSISHFCWILTNQQLNYKTYSCPPPYICTRTQHVRNMTSSSIGHMQHHHPLDFHQHGPKRHLHRNSDPGQREEHLLSFHFWCWNSTTEAKWLLEEKIQSVSAGRAAGFIWFVQNITFLKMAEAKIED